jgi:hypothetical protein
VNRHRPRNISDAFWHGDLYDDRDRIYVIRQYRLRLWERAVLHGDILPADVLEAPWNTMPFRRSTRNAETAQKVRWALMAYKKRDAQRRAERVLMHAAYLLYERDAMRSMISSLLGG